MNKAMVVAPQSEPAEIALEVLESGGNAFDGAIAGAFAQGVVDPHRSGIGGFGAATLFVAESKEVLSITFFGRAGSAATPDMWTDILEGPAPDGFGYVLDGKVNDVGYKSITVPGMVAGMGEIHARYGSMPWSGILAGPADLARRGFLVGPQMAAFWRRPGLFGRVSTRDRLEFTKAGRQIWLPGGEPPEAGDKVRQEALAETYDRLAEAGPGDFYSGALARQIATDWSGNDALITARDLESYRCLWQKPIEGRFSDRKILSTPLPGGGLALLQALRMAEIGGLLEMKLNSPGYVDLLGRILSAVQSDRAAFQSDPEFDDVDTGKLLSDTYLKNLLAGTGEQSSNEPGDTTEIAVVDGLGNAIVLSHSLGYGSGVFTPGLGFMYNNCMSGFDPRPGRPASIAPGKARSTAIAQTVVLRDDEPDLVIGSPGGSHITAGLTQALINFVHFDLDLQDAVCRPRLDAYRRTLLLEARMPFKLEDTLSQRWTINRSPNPFGTVGRIYAIAFTKNGPRPGYDPGEPAVALDL